MGRSEAALGRESPAPAPAPYDGELPPSYSEATGKESAPGTPFPSSSTQRPVENAGPSNPRQMQIPRQFPSAFNIYRGGMMTRTYILGEHQNQPIYAISIHSGMFDSAPIVLHSGPDEMRPPLATVEWQTFGSSFDVSLPPTPGSKRDVAEEHVESRFGGFAASAYQFSIEVGQSNVRETFEWRHSYGDAIANLGGYYGGWKLVRMNRGPPGGGGSGDANYVSGGFTDSEGNEVVAAYTQAISSLTKVATFQFMGTGDSGVLGERWAILAVITAFALYYKQVRRNRNR